MRTAMTFLLVNILMFKKANNRKADVRLNLRQKPELIIHLIKAENHSDLILLNDKLPFAFSPVTHILHRPSLSTVTVNFPLLSPFPL